MFAAVTGWSEAVLKVLTVVVSLVLCSAAWAQDPQLTPQQERMRSCNRQAGKKDLQGRDSQAFMSQCLKGAANDKVATSQQKRMKSCNAQAGKKDLKGDERKEFMSRCLKGDAG